MITYRRRGLVHLAETWYAVEESPNADIITYRGLSSPIEGSQPFPTIWIDLEKPEEQLFSEMSRTTRYNVRKAGEYGLHYDFWHPDVAGKLNEFIEFYDAALAAVKGQPRADRVALRVRAAAGVLDLSRVSDHNSNPLVWHAHFRDPLHAQQTHTVSAFRSRQDSAYRTFLGRANRWGCWEDMKRFKRDGIRIYDFGGWYAGTEDKELLGVNEFKRGFGGRIVKTYVCRRAATPLGQVYLWARRLKRSHSDIP